MSREVADVEQRSPQGSLRDLYYVLFRHKWKMILFFLAVIVTVVVGTFHSPDIYRSEAKLLVRLGRESVTLDPTATIGQIINVSRSRESEVNLELEILKNRELLEKVVDSIGPQAFLKRTDRKLSVKSVVRKILTKGTQVEPLDDRDGAVLEVIKNLEIKDLQDSSVISISYEADSPKLAQDVIAKLIDVYLEKHIAVHQTLGSHQFFLQQSEHLRSKLALSENELRNLKDEIGISSLEEQRLIIMNRIGDMERQTGAAEAELSASKAKTQALRKMLDDIPEVLVTQETTGFSDHAVDLMRAKLYELRLKEQDLVSKFAEGSQQMQMVRREVAEAKALLDREMAKTGRAEVTKGVNSAYKQLQSALFTEQAVLSSLQAKVENMRRQLANAQAGLKTLNDADLRMTRLKRDISIQEANYLRYSENLEQARIDHALEAEKISNISIVQSATLPTRPVPQQKLLNLALGFFVGVFGAIGLAFFFEYIDHSIRTPEEAEEKLLLPILASIPRVRANRIRLTGNRRRQSVPAKWRIPAKIRKHYNVFREELLLSSNSESKAPYVFAVISCHHGEGVSTVAANLSAMLAQLDGGCVLLVDANIRCPSAHRIFGVRLSPGLANILTADQAYGDIIVSWRFQNLHILTAGITNGIPSEIFRPAQFTKLLNSMKEDYRYVVLDMPAVREVSSAAILASLCDGVVLVVEAERLRWEVVLKAKTQLLKLDANTIGVVLNKRRFPIPGWLYRTL